MARWIIIFLLINDAENYSTLFFSALSYTVACKAENHFLSTRNVDIFYVGNFLIGVETFCDGNCSHIENYASREYGNGEE